MILRLLALSVSALIAFGSARAETPSAPPAGRHVEAKLLSEHVHLAPGKRAWLALSFTISPGWHMYWKGQNDTGLPPQVTLDLPAEFKQGEILWPSPKRHVSPGDLVDSIVEEQMTLLIPIDVPVNAKPGSVVKFGAKAEWLVCQDTCLLEDATLEISIPVRDTTPAAEADAKAREVFASARDRLPRKLPKDNPPATIEWRGDTVKIVATDATEVLFHAETGGVALKSSTSETAAKGKKLEFHVKPAAAPDQRLLGVLEVRKENKKADFYIVSVSQSSSPKGG